MFRFAVLFCELKCIKSNKLLSEFNRQANIFMIKFHSVFVYCL